ncbi:MAG: hypothetical protein LBJ93_03345 [Clostridiales bacterium]|jgi:hypothetical protein|nr:hypothetical protein [Clostridiales bacterium]
MNQLNAKKHYEWPKTRGYRIGDDPTSQINIDFLRIFLVQLINDDVYSNIVKDLKKDVFEIFNSSDALMKILVRSLLKMNNILEYLELDYRCSNNELTQHIKTLISLFSEIAGNNSTICSKLFSLCAPIKFYMMLEVKSKIGIINREIEESEEYKRRVVSDDLDWNRLQIITRQLLEKQIQLNFIRNFGIALLIITGSASVIVGAWFLINLHNITVSSIISISLGAVLLLACIFWLIFEIHKKNPKRRDLYNLTASK